MYIALDKLLKAIDVSQLKINDGYQNNGFPNSLKILTKIANIETFT